jgi:hypothetical protein
MASSLEKSPITSVRRLVSPMRRSIRLVECGPDAGGRHCERIGHRFVEKAMKPVRFSTSKVVPS